MISIHRLPALFTILFPYGDRFRCFPTGILCFRISEQELHSRPGLVRDTLLVCSVLPATA